MLICTQPYNPSLHDAVTGTISDNTPAYSQTVYTLTMNKADATPPYSQTVYVITGNITDTTPAYSTTR